jgi:hypothetical protein
MPVSPNQKLIKKLKPALTDLADILSIFSNQKTNFIFVP